MPRFLCLSTLFLAATSIPALASEVFPGWPEATEASRPWTRWWWPGSAVTESGVAVQLRAMAEAGIGGVEITPIYGAKGAEEAYVDFLSPRWVALLESTVWEAAEHGMRVDLATGTGWPFGGPQVTPEMAAKRATWRDGAMVVEPTGQRVKRAAPGGEGYVLDPFSAPALKAYLERFEAAFADLPETTLRSQFHDSFEYYGANWAAALAARFEAMHSYSPAPFWELLLGEGSVGVEAEKRARLRRDYRVVLDALHQDYLQAWTDWAHTHGWLTRNQSHGAPANLLDLYAIADIPETEVFGSTPFPIPGLRREADSIREGTDLPEPLVTRMASSAAHVMGKPLVSSETATWLRDHWKVTLAMVKPEIDRIFLDGINHVFYHGTVFSPPEADWPGWLFYASTQFNPNNPWWRDFGALNTYVERVQRVLQGGRPGNDVLLYWPIDDLWQTSAGPLVKQLSVHGVDFVLEQPMGVLAQRLKEAGYAFDYISDRQVQGLRVEDGKLVAPGGRYAVVIVPPAEVMPLATLEALADLAKNGGQVIFADWPIDVPGWGNLPARRAELRTLLGKLAKMPEVSLLGDSLELLAQTGAAQEPMATVGLECIRRQRSDGTDYFIANLTGTPFDGWVRLGTAAMGATLLDPLTGEAGVARLRHPGAAPEVRLQVESGASIIVRTLGRTEARGEAWLYLEPSGEVRELDRPWALEFVAGGPVLPEARLLDELGSWTDLPDPELKRFAGTGRYATTFTLKKPGAAADWVLDLGDLRDSARIFVNGHLAGTVWSLPSRLSIGKWLRTGENTLEIEVTNTAANRIRDLDRRGVDWKIMHEINFVNIHYRPFDASDWSIQPAGLLGPVTLVPMRAIEE